MSVPAPTGALAELVDAFGLAVWCEPAADGRLLLHATSPCGSAAFTGTSEELCAVLLAMADHLAAARQVQLTGDLGSEHDRAGGSPLTPPARAATPPVTSPAGGVVPRPGGAGLVPGGRTPPQPGDPDGTEAGPA